MVIVHGKHRHAVVLYLRHQHPTSPPFLSVRLAKFHIQGNRREVTVVVCASAGEVTPPLFSGTSCTTAAPQPDAGCRPSCQSHRTSSILNPRTLSSALRLPPRRQRRPVCRRTSIRSFPRPHKAREILSAAVPTAPLLTEDGGRVPRSGRSVRRLHTVHRTAKRSRQCKCRRCLPAA